jgi:hypothetical protein
MNHSRRAAHFIGMMLAVFLVSQGEVCLAQDTSAREELEVPSDPRLRTTKPPSRWQRLRENLRGRRTSGRAADPDRAAVERPKQLSPDSTSSTGRGGRAVIGQVVASPPSPVAAGSAANRPGTAIGVPPPDALIPSPARAAAPIDPGVSTATVLMQDPVTQDAANAVATPEAIPTQQPQVEPAPAVVALPPIQQPGYQVMPPGPDAEESPDGFGRRLFNAYFKKEEEKKEEAEAEEGTVNRRVNLPTPFAPAPPFPFADHTGPNIGVNDTSVYPFMQAVYEGPNGDWWKKSRIKFYGWADPSYNASTSKNSNIPMSYNIVPNSLQLSQLVWIFERPLDTVQMDHFDWGFKFTNLFGIDYRYTTAKGYFSDQLLKENHLYGYDPLQMYVDLYSPKVALGTILRMGRYISPIDIEAQLSPENYLYTHSLMYTYDPYTFTGIQSITLWTPQFTTMLGVHGGNDMAPWTAASQPNGEILAKWVSKSGKDALFGGLDSIGKGYFSHGHDDLQVLAGTYSHKFTDRFHTLTEVYYIWERDARVGGTVTYGPPEPYFLGVGPGARLPGLSYSVGAVNYTAYKLNDKSYIVWRNDVLDDPRGYRTGFPGAVFETTFGWIYHITPWCVSRPEVRFDWTSGEKAYDNGTKREQFTFNWDIIIRF